MDQPSVAIDRIAPTVRPRRIPVMRQHWRNLLFLHWECPVEALRSLVPPPLEIDVHEGKTYIGLVPFTMRHVRPIWAPSVPWLSFFHETNVRAYVRLGGEPGVWFFSLDAANPIAAALGRSWFRLPYHWAKMRLERKREPDAAIHYETRRRPIANGSPGGRISWKPRGPARQAQPGTLEFFLIERYLLFTERPGGIDRGQVYHAPYPVRDADLLGWEQNLIEAAGLPSPQGEPLVHCSDGVEVDIFGLDRR